MKIMPIKSARRHGLIQPPPASTWDNNSVFMPRLSHRCLFVEANQEPECKQRLTRTSCARNCKIAGDAHAVSLRRIRHLRYASVEFFNILQQCVSPLGTETQMTARPLSCHVLWTRHRYANPVLMPTGSNFPMNPMLPNYTDWRRRFMRDMENRLRNYD